MQNITAFDTQAHHIHLAIFVTTKQGIYHKVKAILDTGAPVSEFSDQFLFFAGFLEVQKKNVVIKTGLQTQKYERIILPSIEICGHRIKNFKVFVSHFEKSWGVDALIGLDFFRYFKVTVDYKKGALITEPLSLA